MTRSFDQARTTFAAAVAGAIALSCIAYAGFVPGFIAAHGVDKPLHAAMGFTLTYLLARALPSPSARAFLAALLVFIPVAIDEYLQRYSASRSSDLKDLVADIVGIGLAVLLSTRPAPKVTPSSEDVA